MKPVSALTPEQVAEAATIQEKAARARAKVREAYENGRRAGLESAQGLLDRAHDAQRASHVDEMRRADHRFRQHLHAEVWGGRWMGIVVGILVGSLATMGLFWTGLDPLMGKGFEAASEATARGVAIGSVQREARGSEAQP